MRSTTEGKAVKEKTEKKTKPMPAAAKTNPEAAVAKAVPAPAPTKPASKKQTSEWSAPSEKVAERAYLIWEARGGEHGCDEQDWLQAEAELRNQQ